MLSQVQRTTMRKRASMERRWKPIFGQPFLLATSYTSDPEAIKMLKLLYANHTRQGKELQRRIQLSAKSSPAALQSDPRSLPSKLPGGNAALPVAAQPPPRTPAPTLQVLASNFVPEEPQRSTPEPKPSSFDHPASDPQPQPQQKRSSAVLHAQHLPAPQKPMQSFAGTNTWNDRKFAAFEGESASGYGSRHFFIGQASTDASIFEDSQPLQRGSSLGGQIEKLDLLLCFFVYSYRVPFFRVAGIGQGAIASSQTPATFAVESLDRTEKSEMADTFDRSYFLLSQTQDIPPDEEPEDPFNKFWDVVENFVQKISISTPTSTPTPTPTATPTPAPALMDFSRPDPSRPLPGRGNSNNFNLRSNETAMSDTLRSANMLNSYFVVPNDGMLASTASFVGSAAPYDARQTLRPLPLSNRGGGEVTTHDPHPLGDKRDVDPGGRGADWHSSRSPISSSKTKEELLAENEQLKQSVDLLSKKLAFLERAAEENKVLKSSIIQFKQDSTRRASSSSASATSGMVNLAGAEEPAVYLQRIAALEDELRRVKEEAAEKLEVMEKYKDRWEKLKRKKEAKALAGGHSGAVDGAAAANDNGSAASSSGASTSNNAANEYANSDALSDEDYMQSSIIGSFGPVAHRTSSQTAQPSYVSSAASNSVTSSKRTSITARDGLRYQRTPSQVSSHHIASIPMPRPAGAPTLISSQQSSSGSLGHYNSSFGNNGGGSGPGGSNSGGGGGGSGGSVGTARTSGGLNLLAAAGPPQTLPHVVTRQRSASITSAGAGAAAERASPGMIGLGSAALLANPEDLAAPTMATGGGGGSGGGGGGAGGSGGQSAHHSMMTSSTASGSLFYSMTSGN
ncbi:hypothetical protein DFJ73DRAFT_39866 [Zopfochytrium polystomum]|nr:hypothetical protein DFJ73DRAFT_39866 [Zopfochytrium polystomum]